MLGDVLTQDIRFAMRQLVRSRSFAATAIATLAIGVGATVAVFSVVDAVVLRPFPFQDADRVVNVHPAHDGAPQPISSNLEFATWRALPRTFDQAAALVPLASFILTRGDAPEVLTGTRSTSALTEVFGVNPEVGRGFGPADDQPGAPHVVLLSHSLWMRDFDGARAIVGQSIRLDSVSYEVIGVMPASFDVVYPGSAVWVPLTLSSTDLLDFKQRNLLVVARLAPGVSVRQAASAVDGAEQRLQSQYPTWGSGYTGQVTRFADDAIGPVRSRLFILLGAVSFVFLIACVNVANLLLARGSTRAREIGVRTALGAGRERIIGQLLTESALLCVVAAAVGVALAFGLVRALVALSPPGVPRIGESHIDARVLLVTLGVAALCTTLVGLFPAVRVAGATMLAALREGGRGSGEGRTRGRARNVLVAGEVALAMALLTGAGLLIRTAWAISHVDPGFDSGHLLTAQLLPPPARYPDLRSGGVVYRAIREGLSRTPGVEGTALASSLPFQVPFRAGVGAEGRPFTDGERQIADLHIVSPDYFATMKMRLLEGRDFAPTDNADAPNVAIISEALARKLWPGERAVGKRMEGMDPSHQHFMTVVGLVRDPRDAAVDQLPHPEFYIPYEQNVAGAVGEFPGVVGGRSAHGERSGDNGASAARRRGRRRSESAAFIRLYNGSIAARIAGRGAFQYAPPLGAGGGCAPLGECWCLRFGCICGGAAHA